MSPDKSNEGNVVTQPSPQDEKASGRGRAASFKVIPSASPAGADGASIAALQLILKIEREARNAATSGELVFLIANETRKVLNARQIFVASLPTSKRVEIVGISSLTAVDRNSPAVRWMEQLISRMAKEAGAGAARQFALPAYCEESDPETRVYPFRELIWIPLKTKQGEVFAGLILARETPWGESDLPVLTRITETFAHAWMALRNPVSLNAAILLKKRAILGVAAVLALLCLLPVPLTALAPAEVVPESPVVVAAPIEGIIDEIVVEPNTQVKAGAILFRFNDTQTRNTLEVAEREVQVAEAKWRQVAQAAFVDSTAKRELAITEAEYNLKRAERDYARDLLQKSVVRAARDGLVVFNDKRELHGRPVTIGQRIMELADPRRVAFRINVPVEDAVVLEPGALVRVFLDSDPLNPLGGRIVRSSHSARVGEANQLSFRVEAAPTDQSGPLPRLGLRGTAQLYGPNVALGFYLFRRPIAYLRQRFGI